MTADGIRGLALASARLATGRLGWLPETFWASTPRELATALEGLAEPVAPPLDPTSLARLKELHPDA